MKPVKKAIAISIIGLFTFCGSALWAASTPDVAPQILAKSFKPRGDGGSCDVPAPATLAKRFKPQGDGGSHKLGVGGIDC